MKVYTGSGDHGKTSLFSGERLSKSHHRIDAYGDVDELNSVIGGVIDALPPEAGDERETLNRIQSDLMDIGGWLSALPGSAARAALTPLDNRRAEFLEAAIDRMDARLPALKAFVLPGGSRAAVWAHLARTVCRRAERHVVRVADDDLDAEGLAPTIVYLNRLSDYCFVLARYVNHLQQVPDIQWHGT